MSEQESDFSLINIISPLTTSKAITFFIIIGLIVYFKIFTNGFVWDDETFIIYNPQIQHFDLPALIGNNMFNSSGYYRVIPAIYFSFLYSIVGNQSFLYHFLQLILHVVDTSLLFLFFKHFLKKPLSFLLSLIFLVHPINIESVAYIGATQSVIYFFFGMLALYLNLNNTISRRRIILIHLLLLLSLLTKEVSILFFILLYLYRVLYKKLIPREFILATGITLGIYIFIRLVFLGKLLEHLQGIPIAQLPLLARMTHIPIILMYYLKMFFYPNNFAIDQIWTIAHVDFGNFFLPLFSLLGISLLIICFGIFLRGRDSLKTYYFFLVWYILGMGMLLQIFPLDMTVADRWFYFPIVGLLGIIGITLQNISVYKRHKQVIFALFCFILLVLSYITSMRVRDWESPLILYKHDLAIQYSPIIEEAYGIDLGDAGQYRESIAHLKKAVAYQEKETNLANLANSYQNMGDLQNALIYYERAMQVGVITDQGKKHYDNTYLNYANALLRLHQNEKAKMIVSQGLAQFPDSYNLWSLALSIDEARGDQTAASIDQSKLQNFNLK